ncbi:MAG: hypothetical protein AAFX94_11920, partial [Myxococcota bacterium]
TVLFYVFGTAFLATLAFVAYLLLLTGAYLVGGIVAAVLLVGIAAIVWMTVQTSNKIPADFAARVVSGPIELRRVAKNTYHMFIAGELFEPVPHWQRFLSNGQSATVRLAFVADSEGKAIGNRGIPLAVAHGPSAEAEAIAGVGFWPAFSPTTMLAFLVALAFLMFAGVGALDDFERQDADLSQAFTALSARFAAAQHFPSGDTVGRLSIGPVVIEEAYGVGDRYIEGVEGARWGNQVADLALITSEIHQRLLAERKAFNASYVADYANFEREYDRWRAKNPSIFPTAGQTIGEVAASTRSRPKAPQVLPTTLKDNEIYAFADASYPVRGSEDPVYVALQKPIRLEGYVLAEHVPAQIWPVDLVQSLVVGLIKASVAALAALAVAFFAVRLLGTFIAQRRFLSAVARLN